MFRTMKFAFLAIIGVLVTALVLDIVNRHFQSACYSNELISSESKAIEAAKELIVKSQLFDFPGLGTAEDFVAAVAEHPRCCGAARDFSFIRFASVWNVVLSSAGAYKYTVFIQMDECARKIFDRGIVAD